MSHHPPSVFEMLSATVYLILLVLALRFVLRRFLGVSRLQRDNAQLRQLVAALAAQLQVELPAVAAAPLPFRVRVAQRMQAARARVARLLGRQD